MVVNDFSFIVFLLFRLRLQKRPHIYGCIFMFPRCHSFSTYLSFYYFYNSPIEEVNAIVEQFVYKETISIIVAGFLCLTLFLLSYLLSVQRKLLSFKVFILFHKYFFFFLYENLLIR